jgi:6-pyruvoyltetrahydropterin/6-carboxytetrahydropterin synthase
MSGKIIRVTKIFSFEAAHALEAYDGPCRNIHGHSYKLFVTVKGPVLSSNGNAKDGMVLDFKELKSIVQEYIINVFDHSLVLKEGTTLIFNNSCKLKLVYLPFQPTSENLISYFAKSIQDKLPGNVHLFSLKLAETETSFAEWFERDQ